MNCTPTTRPSETASGRLNRVSGRLNTPVAEIPVQPLPVAFACLPVPLPVTEPVIPSIDKPSTPSRRSIMAAVAAVMNMPSDRIRSKRRGREQVRARWLFYYISVKKFGISSPRSGYYCGCDHSTCLYGIAQIKLDILAWQERIDACMAALGTNDKEADGSLSPAPL